MIFVFTIDPINRETGYSNVLDDGYDDGVDDGDDGGVDDGDDNGVDDPTLTQNC